MSGEPALRHLGVVCSPLLRPGEGLEARTALPCLASARRVTLFVCPTPPLAFSAPQCCGNKWCARVAYQRQPSRQTFSLCQGILSTLGLPLAPRGVILIWDGIHSHNYTHEMIGHTIIENALSAESAFGLGHSDSVCAVQCSGLTQWPGRCCCCCPPNGSSIKISLLSVSLTFYLAAVFSNKSLLFAPTQLGQATFFQKNLDGLKIRDWADRGMRRGDQS